MTLFHATRRTVFHATGSPHVVWASRAGAYIYFRVENRTLPLAMVARSSGRWYARTHHNNATAAHATSHPTRDAAEATAIQLVLGHGPVARK